MSKKAHIHLSESKQQMICEILQKNVPNRIVWAFGSCVNGHPKPYSDLDLVMLGDTPLTLAEYANLADDFSQSDLESRF